jgi:hypothetical protein
MKRVRLPFTDLRRMRAGSSQICVSYLVLLRSDGGDDAARVDLGWQRHAGGGVRMAALEDMWPRQPPLHSGVCRQ